MKQGKSQVVGTMAELFAGVGGFRLGLEKYWDTVFSNQFEPSTNIQHASSCYLRNYPGEGHVNRDIALVVEEHLKNGKEIPRTDLLVGGFPCQDYSVAKSLNASKGLEGKKGVLWWDIYKIVKQNRPKYIFLENVDRLLKSPSGQRGRDFAIMLRTLGDLGYLIEWRLVNAAEHGFPQRRIRVFIVAKSLEHIRNVPRRNEEKTFLESGGLLAQTFPGKLSGALSSFSLDEKPENITEFFPTQKISPFGNAGYYLAGQVHTSKLVFTGSKQRATLGNVVLRPEEVPQEFWIPEEDVELWRRLKDKKSIPRVHKASGTKFMYSEGKMAFPDSLEKPSRTIVTGEGGSSPSRFKHVIIQNGRYRRLTPVELEKLNGFKPDWTKYGNDGKVLSDTRRAFFMGNALVVGLVAMVGKTLAEDHQE